MKPTIDMLRPVKATSSEDKRFDISPRPSDIIQALVQRKAAIERALTETRQQLRNGEISKAIDQRLQALANAPIQKPTAGSPSAVVVRVVGFVDGTDEGARNSPRSKGRNKVRPTRLPLPGLHVEICFRKVAVATTNTDMAGLAVLQLPEGTKGNYELHARGTDGKIAATHRGRKTEANQPALLLEVVATRTLAPAIERGSVWIDAAEKARRRGEVLQSKLTAALARQETLLVASLARVDAAIAASQ